MNNHINTATNEEGFILVGSLWMLVILVLIGIGSMLNTSTEVLISGNDKFHKMSFYNADSGIYTSPKVIARAMDAGTDPVEPNLTLFGIGSAANNAPTDGTRFYSEIMGFVSDPDTNIADMQYAMEQETVSVDIVHNGVKILVGGGAEFAAGASGIGAGATGGVAIQYIFNASATAPSNSQSTITARYRKIPGTAGGL